jgi:hypothetical protein
LETYGLGKIAPAFEVKPDIGLPFVDVSDAKRRRQKPDALSRAVGDDPLRLGLHATCKLVGRDALLVGSLRKAVGRGDALLARSLRASKGFGRSAFKRTLRRQRTPKAARCIFGLRPRNLHWPSALRPRFGWKPELWSIARWPQRTSASQVVKTCRVARPSGASAFPESP